MIATDSRTQLGAVIRTARDRAGLSLRDLERHTRINNAELSRYEGGQRVPQPQVAALLDNALRTGNAVSTLTAAIRQAQERGRRGTVVPQQLPPVPGRLVGRETLLSEMNSREGSTVIVDGPAGVGKTAFVAAWAGQDRSRWPDGILTADLKGYRPDAQPAAAAEIAAELLRGLGLAVPELAEDRLRLLRTALAERRALIILDDAANAAQVRPLLASGPCTIVITSRRKLSGLVIRDGAGHVPVAPLAPSDAEQLLGDLTGAADHGAVAEISHACDHLPLALHAAAVAVDMHAGRPLSEVRDQLTGPHRVDWLTAAAADDPAAALRVVLAASVHRLSSPAQRCLRELANLDHAERTIPFELIEQDHCLVSEIVREHLALLTADGLILPSLVRAYSRTVPTTDLAAAATAA